MGNVSYHFFMQLVLCFVSLCTCRWAVHFVVYHFVHIRLVLLVGGVDGIIWLLCWALNVTNFF